MSSTKNTVIVALMQIGVIVAGVLGAAVWHKLATTQGIRLPSQTVTLYTFGVECFLIPIAWFIIALTLITNDNISDHLKLLAFWSGVLILLGLGLFIIRADILPLLITV